MASAATERIIRVEMRTSRGQTISTAATKGMNGSDVPLVRSARPKLIPTATTVRRRSSPVIIRTQSQPTIEHSRAYLHHLFKQHEPLFMTLASLHNLIFMNKLMAGIRERIMRDEI